MSDRTTSTPPVTLDADGAILPYEETFSKVLGMLIGGTPVRRALAELDESPFKFYRYMDTQPGAAERYARARATMLDALADEAIEIADTALIGTKKRETKDGEFTETGDNVERARLMVETRKWLLAKLAPRKYGDLVQVEHSGNIGNALAERLADGRKRLAAATDAE